MTACTLRVQVNLDGYALPIKKLKGTEPVESLDLSGKNLGVASAIVIASLISVNGSLTSLDLSSNQLCGVTIGGSGTYTADGITAIADALRVNGSLTKMWYVSPRTNLSEFGPSFLHPCASDGDCQCSARRSCAKQRTAAAALV